ncbi:MAG TPA: hypothetical protein VLT61_02440, partial [Anaeromyxobacteraceae bacterium]|nr:hypothetical protein [Anaeromyxobacteraceae bacterium]
MARLKDIGVAARLYLLVTVFVAGFAAFGLVFEDTLRTLEIQGPIYRRIIEGKDLVADILPPPAYVIESYLVVLQASNEADPSRIAALRARFDALRREYGARREFWSRTLADRATREALLERSWEPAREFYDLATAEYFPALAAGDRARAGDLAFGPLKARYDAHRAAIDDVVRLATASQAVEERDAAEVVRTRSRLLVALASGIVLLTAGLCLVVIRSVIGQVGGEPAEIAGL